MINYTKHPLVLYILFLLLALFWSASFLAIKISIVFFSPIFAAMLRVAIAFLALSLLFCSMKTPLRLPLRTAMLLWMQGIIGQSMAFIFLFWGEQYIAPALASIINAMVPLWVLLINGVILREKNTFTLTKTLGLALGFSGIIIIFGPLISTSEEKSALMTCMGALSVSAMAISYAIAAISYQKIFARTEINFKASIWHQHLGSFIFLFFFSLCAHSWPEKNLFSSFSYHALMAIIYLGVFSTALAWMIYSYLIVQWGTVRAVSVLYIVPLFAIVWDVLFLSLTIHFYEIVGMIIILLGILFVQMPNQESKHLPLIKKS